jgi:hypothetical protein
MTSPQPDDRPSCRLAQLSLEFRAELPDRVEGRRADGTGSAARLDDFTPTFFMMTTSPWLRVTAVEGLSEAGRRLRFYTAGERLRTQRRRRCAWY